MALDYFQILEDDFDILSQVMMLEEEIKGEAMKGSDLIAYARYGRVYVAMEGDELLGCCFLLGQVGNAKRSFLYSVSAKPGEAGRGIGVKLLDKVFFDLKSSGVTSVETMVHPENIKALRIYRSSFNFDLVPDEETADKENYLILRKTL